MAAMEQAHIRPRYTLRLFRSKRCATMHIMVEKVAIERIVPTANVARYAIACERVGSARDGRTARK